MKKVIGLSKLDWAKLIVQASYVAFVVGASVWASWASYMILTLIEVNKIIAILSIIWFWAFLGCWIYLKRNEGVSL